MRRAWLSFALFAVFFGSPVALGAPATPTNPAIEKRARAIERQLTAPCCYKGTLEDHASAVAGEMRQEIRRLLQAGKTQGQILEHYRARYGQAVLVEPPKGGLSGLMLYGIPFGLAILGLVVMTAFMARRRKEGAETQEDVQGVPDALPPAMEARIDALVAGNGVTGP